MHINEFRSAAPVNPNPVPVASFQLPKASAATLGEWFHDALLHEGAATAPERTAAHSAPVLQPPRIAFHPQVSLVDRITDGVRNLAGRILRG